MKLATQRDRRGVSILSKFTDAVLRESIIPLGDRLDSLPMSTTFYFTEHDSLRIALHDIISRDCPTICTSKQSLLDAVSTAYDEAFQQV